MYKPIKWVDRVTDVDSGEILREGTPQSAGNFNSMDEGITDMHIAGKLIAIAMETQVGETANMLIAAIPGFLGDKIALEEKSVTLRNTSSYPFNNSEVTVTLSTTRANNNYTVEAEVMEHDGDVGHIIVSEKLLNGFKLRYDGSARSATVKLIIQGGM